MGKNQNNPGIQLEATEENSDEKAQKTQKQPRMDPTSQERNQGHGIAQCFVDRLRIDANKPEVKKANGNGHR